MLPLFCVIVTSGLLVLPACAALIVSSYEATEYPASGREPLWHRAQSVERIGAMSCVYATVTAPAGAAGVVGVVDDDDEEDVDVEDGAVEAAEVSVAGSRVTHAGANSTRAMSVVKTGHCR